MSYPSPSQSSLVFIDESVADYETLVAGVAHETEVVLISSQQESITYITNKLQKKYTLLA